jgi:hypothetical protein
MSPHHFRDHAERLKEREFTLHLRQAELQLQILFPGKCFKQSCLIFCGSHRAINKKDFSVGQSGTDGEHNCHNFSLKGQH